MNKLWNIANFFAKKGGHLGLLLSRMFELLNHIICSCSVSAKAEIGDGTEFLHRGIGCVIHPKVVIGKKCKIFQHVTLGSKWSDGICEGDAPTIGDNVLLGAGCVILGNITIGKNSIIGANTVILKDVPPNSIAVGNPASITTNPNKDSKR